MLNRLKKSPLNVNRKRSVKAKFLLKVKFTTFVPGPVNGFLGEVPGATAVLLGEMVATLWKDDVSNHSSGLFN